jgi:predicted methyltransferase
MIALRTALMLMLFTTPALAADDFSQRAAAASTGDHRSAENIARNQYRHPVETLEFFGIGDGMSVLEIWPGGAWYTEILAPALNGYGSFSLAEWDPNVPGQPNYRYDLPKQTRATIDASPEVYGDVGVVYYSPPESASLGEEGSYDAVLTFRAIHGLVNNGQAQDVFNEFARVLKPGGVLGVVQHRAADGTDPAVTARSGYVSQEYVTQLASNAGLVLEAASEVNANPADTRDYPGGVWTLPPGLREGDKDREKYLAIGESDRMTLRFRKPQ